MDLQGFIGDLRIIILFSVFLFFVEWYLLMEEQLKNAISKTITVTNQRIEIEAERFNFAEEVAKLRRYGILRKYPKIEKPYYYLLVHLFIGLFLGGLLSFVTPLLFPIGLIVGIILPRFYFKHSNQKDNEEMRDDVLMLYNILSTQSKGGAYLGAALGECKDLIVNERLRVALEEFDDHMRMQDITLNENLILLESKFENPDISSLCLIVRQNEESGRNTDILKDIKKQIADTEEMVLEKKKEQMERSMTIVMLILFADSMGFILYEFVLQILKTM